MSDLLAVLDALLGHEPVPKAPRRFLEDIARELRKHEARERYLLAYGDPWAQKVLRGEMDAQLLEKP